MYIVQRQGTSWVLESYIYSTDAVRFLYINYSLLIFEKHYISRLSQQTIPRIRLPPYEYQSYNYAHLLYQPAHYQLSKIRRVPLRT